MPLKDIFVEYSQETTAHAIPQIFDSGRRAWARIFWTIVLLVFCVSIGYISVDVSQLSKIGGN